MKKITPLFYLLFLLAMQPAGAQIRVLYGMTSQGGAYGNGTIIKINGNGADFDTVYSFANEYVGYGPMGSLLLDTNGLLYGMTEYGGSKNIGDYGVIFSFDPSKNSYTDLHNFNDIDGANPLGNLIQATNGLLYGVTSAGGTAGFGVIFSFDLKTDSFTNLYSFSTLNGINPTGSLLQYGNNLYGLTSGGGNFTYGIIFSFNILNNTFSKVYDFNGISGEIPYGSLVVSNSTLYGLTSAGGIFIQNKDTTQNGVIFSFNPSNNSYSDVYNFEGNGGGVAPHGSLISAVDGNLYGMTELGDNNGGTNGTLFSFNPSGSAFKTLYDFNGINGSLPHGSVVQGSDGNLYGMTTGGGDSTYGTIFRYDLSYSSLTSLASFNNALGAVPYGDLVQLGTDTGSGIYQLSVVRTQISIYPNPSDGAITVSSSKNIDKLTVTNMLGQVIYTALPKQTHVNFTIKESGMYFIATTSGGQTSTSKAVVNK